MTAEAIGRERSSERASLAAQLADFAARQEQHLFAWCPVCLLVGVWSYFGLSVEPPLLVFFLAGATVLVLAFAHRVGTPKPLATALCLVLAGFCLAKLRTEWIAAPLLPATAPQLTCAGEIEALEQ